MGSYSENDESAHTGGKQAALAGQWAHHEDVQYMVLQVYHVNT